MVRRVKEPNLDRWLGQTVADAQPLQVDLDRASWRRQVVLPDAVRHCWDVMASV